ncbi:HipA N-terminal domain-containing protein [Rhizobium pusense]|uniref:HipA N-terminal domain-containing protein n=1 Tax=Agrobacterium pusense TaxID=648995 RepID=UPI001F180E21|nr:HipA N-terminal domain-containing protein [Agrobacterium pusense]MDH2089608.1 HipA N-terminal domain-containing protein [Agrobacterium pusense]WCK25607.1 HipA N-terminal domain-containing protein [Agrobacterium pusense]
MTTIYYETLPVAHLTFDGEWTLDYDPCWEASRTAFPVSLTMPLRSGAVGAAKLLPWLANLLPETHFAEIGQRLKVSPQDTVGLLGHIGRDTAGRCLSANRGKRVSTSSPCRMSRRWSVFSMNFLPNLFWSESAVSMLVQQKGNGHRDCFLLRA